jgi:Universal stress protein family
MYQERTRRILVVTDHTPLSEALLAEIARRAAGEDVQFRLVVLNPARDEVHLLHPERHDRAAEAELALRAMLPDLQLAAGAHIIGSVSVRHDPMDAIEEVMFTEPVDEILLAVHEGHLATRLHQDLPHRLAHLDLPVTCAPEPGAHPA